MKKILLLICFFAVTNHCITQVCGTPGVDGPVNIAASINTYYAPAANALLIAGDKSLLLDAVAPNDPYGNSFGSTPIKAGDMLLIIQMQDADIAFTNNEAYGANNPASGPDGLGGTGFLNAGNTGRFEYLIATNAVPLLGGNVTFKGAGNNNGCVFSYTNAPATASRGKKTFQVVRVPQFSNLTLTSNISTPPFNGLAGGIIAFDVSGDMNFNGFTIDASSRGFRGGFGIIAPSAVNINSLYVANSTDTRSVGKGEGIAGTPRYMWDGYNQVDNVAEGLPGGSYGRGAPANAGGGGNDHNAGGGGGGNGGAGGVGGDGTIFGGSGPGTYPNGGRPGSTTYTSALPDIARIVLGGGGGGGDANNALSGVKGGVGGGIILINVGTISGKGSLFANGGDGARGASGTNPDGAGGGGAGGTVFIKVSNPDAGAVLTIEANGGNGGNTENDRLLSDQHGPGGGGGGGLVYYSTGAGSVTVQTIEGKAGFTNSGNGTSHNGGNGKAGITKSYNLTDLPAYLQGGGSACYPKLTTFLSSGTVANRYPGNQFIYTVKTTNATGGGNAGGVQIALTIPSGFAIASALVTYTGNAGGPVSVSNLGSALNARYGDFNISPGDTVILHLIMLVDCAAQPAKYHCSAQTIYLDPSRTIIEPQRRIAAFINAFVGTPTSYQTGTAGNVPGANYNGNNAASILDDITILPLTPIQNNNISIAPLSLVFCEKGDPMIITGSIPTGADETYTYQWQFSAGGNTFSNNSLTSKDFDPPITTATVYYRRVARSVACVAEQNSNVLKISVSQKPKVNFITPGICVKDGIANFINTTSTLDGSDTALLFKWNFGDPASPQNISIAKSGSHNFSSAGDYTVQLQVVSGACMETVSKPFTLNGSIPKADFSFTGNTTLCSNLPVAFIDKATVDFGGLTRVEWYFDLANPTVTKTDSNPAARNAPPASYTHNYPSFHTPATKNVSVKMVVFSGLTCSDEKTMVIALKAYPKIAFGTISPLCTNAAAVQITQGAEVQGLLTGAGSYSGTGITAAGLFLPAVAGTGNHLITYTYVANNGCGDAKSQTITLNQSPTVKGGHVEMLEGGQAVLNINVTGPITNYQWAPPLHLNNVNIASPIAAPLTDTRYTIKVSTANGCTAEDTMLIKILKNPRIPNAFSPNGDGINDVWQIANINSYPAATISIFNRYGQQVFYATGDSDAWDGKNNGKPLPVGTYYYIIDAKTGRKPFRGSVTILR